MLVEATKRGFIGGILREAGDQFKIEEGQFSENWMKEVKAKKAPAKKKTAKAKKSTAKKKK